LMARRSRSPCAPAALLAWTTGCRGWVARPNPGAAEGKLDFIRPGIMRLLDHPPGVRKT
jgi:hypothetical protein